MFDVLRFLVAIGFLAIGLIVGILEAEIAMGPIQWFLAAIVVELLPGAAIPTPSPRR